MVWMIGIYLGLAPEGYRERSLIKYKQKLFSAQVRFFTWTDSFKIDEYLVISV